MLPPLTVSTDYRDASHLSLSPRSTFISWSSAQSLLTRQVGLVTQTQHGRRACPLPPYEPLSVQEGSLSFRQKFAVKGLPPGACPNYDHKTSEGSPFQPVQFSYSGCWYSSSPLLPGKSSFLYRKEVGFGSKGRKHLLLKRPVQMSFASLQGSKVPEHLQQVLFPRRFSL